VDVIDLAILLVVELSLDIICACLTSFKPVLSSEYMLFLKSTKNGSSGGTPIKYYKNTRGHVPAVNRVPPEQRIAVPTVHAWSAKDIQYPGMAKQVMHMCCEESRVGVKHSAGHGVPTQGDEVAALAKAVMEMLEGLE